MSDTIYLVITGADNGHSRLLGAFTTEEEAIFLRNELEYYQKIGVQPCDMPYRAKYFDYVYIQKVELFEKRSEMIETIQALPIPTFKD